MAKKGTNISKSKQAQKAFKQWTKEAYPIYNEANQQLILHPDEVFVEVWDYPHKRRKCSHYVSNYGNVISFSTPEKPLWLTASEDSKTNYLTVGDAWKVHRLVWLSFAADNLRNHVPVRGNNYGIKFTATLKTIKSDKQVHHIDNNRANNKLDNLQLLPKDIHKIFEKFSKKKTEKQRWLAIEKLHLEKYSPIKPSIIMPNNGIVTTADSIEIQAESVTVNPVKYSATIKDNKVTFEREYQIQDDNDNIATVKEKIAPPVGIEADDKTPKEDNK